ncbi:chromatin structure-remodeling complex protein BSH [Daucus carota subsp. sativus]|uniref:chromatin structure-remodeling complex protein BSH n=1 Tax=Daucus carota subsp. sativus TaxID=79200 RepID=UPI0030834A69
MYTGEKIVLVKDLNNFESDPEEFARSFCKDVGIDDPEVGIAVQNVFSARESRISTKGRRGFEHSLPSSRFILISVRLVALHWI